MATYGAKETVQESLTSIQTHDPGVPYRLHIYDSPASIVDGTREYLQSLSSQQVDLICGDTNLSHGQALDLLVTKCDSNLVCAVDSDMVFRSVRWLEAFFNAYTKGTLVVGDVIPEHAAPKLQTIMMSRVHPKLCLFDRQWFLENKLSWQPLRQTIEQVYPAISGALRSAGIKSVYYDTGWQLFLAADARRGVVPFNPETNLRCRHLRGASTRFNRKHWRQIRELGVKDTTGGV